MQTFSVPEAHQIVYDMEKKFDLFQYKVDNWSIWPTLRWDFFKSLTGEKLASDTGSWPVFHLAQIIIEDLGGLAHIQKAKYFVLTKDLNLREQVGEYYQDVFFDDLLFKMSDFLKVDTLHNPAFFDTRKKAKIKNQFSLTLFRRIPLLVPPRFAPTAIHQTAHALSQILGQFTPSKRFSSKRLSREFTGFLISKRLFGWLLDKIQPRFLLLINANGYSSYIAAAKERNVTVIELQHGVVYKYHPGYSWNQAALPYKNSMPIPDFFFLYGRFWKEALEENGFWDSELQVMGSPRLDRFRSFTPQKSSAIHLAVTTQWLVSPSVYGEYFQKLLQLAKGRFDLQITIKLHQKETAKEPYQRWFREHPEVKVVLNHEAPSTFELLKTADLHLSVASTCHYEALALGTPTVILPFMEREAMLPLINRGYGIVCETPEMLIDFIADLEHKSVEKSIGEYFFEPNAVENMLSFLNNLPAR